MVAQTNNTVITCIIQNDLCASVYVCAVVCMCVVPTVAPSSTPLWIKSQTLCFDSGEINGPRSAPASVPTATQTDSTGGQGQRRIKQWSTNNTGSVHHSTN